MPSRITLPPVPEQFAGDAVAAWSEPLVIDTYLPEEPSPYPAFLDSRVYQGSSGRVFPLPFHERIRQTSEPHTWQAVHLENKWVRLVILPELGGRIHVGYDKVADYDFFYRNNVIKPALVGLAGPWVSGGVEFNWPQHHRPGTFLPTDFEIEHEHDGAITVWCSDHDPFTRMKGMHGIRLRPNSSAIEARVRLYNRSDETQTFLWWANVAAAVNDDYQSFFPTDVSYVADHAKRAVATFPRVDGSYYGVDYSARVSPEHPDADRIDWYRNIPVPTSYMVTATSDDFFGGYDHAKQAGFVHWADRGVVPGKKQWTWGNSEFGWAWDRNLTDDDGPYIELMAGAYTDNQPDFSYITPGETKIFSQYWYPIQRIGTVQQATLDAAIHFVPTNTADATVLEIGVATSRALVDATIEVLTSDGTVIFRTTAAISPGSPFVDSPSVHGMPNEAPLRVRLLDADVVVIDWTTPDEETTEKPRLATEPGDPATITSNDELFYTGQYLEQYRHATRAPEPYWTEILARDPLDVRANLALGASCERSHRLDEAERHFRTALERLLDRVPNAAEGEANYRLGMNLVHQGRDIEAIDQLVKAAWNSAWFVPATVALGRLYARRGDHGAGEEALRNALARDPSHLQATCLLSRLLRERGAKVEADRILRAQLLLDPLDQWTRDMLGLPLTTDAPTLLDVAIEYASAGFTSDALRMLDCATDAAHNTPIGQVNVGTIARYHRALLLERTGADSRAVDGALRAASESDSRHSLPSRLTDVDALVFALARNPSDGTASTLLGSWHYAKGNHAEAMALWQQTLAADPSGLTSVIAHRNLGIAEYNVRQKHGAALAHFVSARNQLPTDAKLLYEYDQLLLRTNASAAERRELLEQNPNLVEQRDDLTISYVNLLVEMDEADRAEDIMRSRTFQPWEGGEGQVLAAWDAIKIVQSSLALTCGDGETARKHLSEAMEYPESLGEGRHPLANRSHLWWLTGLAEQTLDHGELAHHAWTNAAAYAGDFVGMATQDFGEQTQWSIRSLNALGRAKRGSSITQSLRDYANKLEKTPARIDFFATSLPSLLTFHDDANQTRQALAKRLLHQVAEFDSSLLAAATD